MKIVQAIAILIIIASLFLFVTNIDLRITIIMYKLRERESFIQCQLCDISEDVVETQLKSFLVKLTGVFVKS